MPAYQLHRLSPAGGDPEPTVQVFLNDDAAMRCAMGERFAQGCDVWQGQRFVGRAHGPATQATDTAVGDTR